MAESASGIRAGAAYIELGVRDKTLAGLARVGAKFKAWGAGIRATGLGLVAIGAAITVPLIAAAKASAESGAALYDMSKRTGVSVERLSVLGYAAAQSGSDLEGLEKSIRLMQKSLTGTDDVMEGTSKALEHLHANASEFVGLRPDQQFDLVAKKINAIKNPTDRAAASMRVFGRSGTAILPMIENLAELEKRGKTFERSTESAKAAKQFTQAMFDATRASKALWSALSSSIIPVLQKKAEWLTRVTLVAREWVKVNKDLVVLVFEVGFAVGLAGTALIVLGKTLSIVGGGLILVTKFFGLLVAVTAAASSPLTLLVTSLTTLAGVFLLNTNAGQRMFDVLATGFLQMKRDATGAWKGIVDALAAGDMKLAMQIAVAFMKLEWERGITFLKTKLTEGIGFLSEAWVTFKFAALDTINTMWAGIQTAFEAGVAGMNTKINDVIDVWKKLQVLFKKEDVLDAAIGNIPPGSISARLGMGKKDPNVHLDDDASAKLLAIENERRAKNLTAAQQHANRVVDIEAEKKAKLVALATKLAADLAGIQAGVGASSTAEIDKLSQQLKDLQKQAAEERKKAEAPKVDQPGLAGPMEAIAKKFSTVGSFSAAGAFGFGPGAVLNRIAKAAEGTEKNTRIKETGLRIV